MLINGPTTGTAAHDSSTSTSTTTGLLTGTDGKKRVCCNKTRNCGPTARVITAIALFMLVGATLITLANVFWTPSDCPYAENGSHTNTTCPSYRFPPMP